MLITSCIRSKYALSWRVEEYRDQNHGQLATVSISIYRCTDLLNMIVHCKMSIFDISGCKSRDILVETRHSSFGYYHNHDVKDSEELFDLRALIPGSNECIDGIDQYFLDVLL